MNMVEEFETLVMQAIMDTRHEGQRVAPLLTYVTGLVNQE